MSQTTNEASGPPSRQSVPEKSNLFVRDVVTPVTLVFFLVASVTGLMLLLGVEGRLVASAHEWLGLVYVGIAAWHIVKNWNSFRVYLRRNWSRAAIVGSIGVALVFTTVTGRGTGDPAEADVSPGAIFQALSKASLASVAPAFNLNVDEASSILSASGFQPAPEMTIGDIAEGANKNAAVVISILSQGARP